MFFIRKSLLDLDGAGLGLLAASLLDHRGQRDARVGRVHARACTVAN